VRIFFFRAFNIYSYIYTNLLGIRSSQGGITPWPPWVACLFLKTRSRPFRIQYASPFRPASIFFFLCTFLHMDPALGYRLFLFSHPSAPPRPCDGQRRLDGALGFFCSVCGVGLERSTGYWRCRGWCLCPEGAQFSRATYDMWRNLAACRLSA
jgi:hypothetical protein